MFCYCSLMGGTPSFGAAFRRGPKPFPVKTDFDCRPMLSASCGGFRMV
uniref:Uncharacterized protein n=1 Tax=Neisseria meningitidis alpha275 TaxID=295996 RepID=C6SNM3_NEIME|nr:hypothetical protein predicted by Glimmer/Critica [Neisseria meningitidis alpha275]